MDRMEYEYCYCVSCSGKKRKLLQNIEKDVLKYGLCPDRPETAYVPYLEDPVQLRDEDFVLNAPCVEELVLDLSMDLDAAAEASTSREDAPAGPAYEADEEAAPPTFEADQAEDEAASEADPVEDDEDEVNQFDACKKLILDWFGDSSSEKVQEMMGNNNKLLFPGSKNSLFGVALALIDFKVCTSTSDTAFDMLLRLLASILPDGNCLPLTTRALRKIVEHKNIRYHAYHACPDDCVVYRGNLEAATSCPECGKPRFKDNTKVPRKCVRHFPIIPVLQLEHKCPERAKLQTWHSTAASTDGKIRSVVDSKGWRDFHVQHPDFANDPRNVHLSLWGDGVSPIISKTARAYSCWPCGFLNLNIPPEMAIRTANIYLSLIIPGPEQAKRPDTYIALLVEELLELWEGVPCDDNARNSFLLRGALMYTVHDAPGMTTLSGFSTKGHSFCYACGDAFKGKSVRHLSTVKYVGHRKFLPPHHELRSANIINFDGQVEDEVIDQRMTSRSWLQRWIDAGDYRPDGMTRLSVFYKLPYWADESRRHLFDFMHVGKNVSVTLLDHLTGQRESSASRGALKEVCSKQSLWNPNVQVPWILSKAEAKDFYQVIKGFKVPTAFAAHSLRDLISEHGLTGLTSHDYHHLLKDVMPIALTGKTTPDIRDAINGLAYLFKQLSSKELDASKMEELRLLAIEVVCKIEMVFPVSAMTTQVHYLIHVAEEVELWGPGISMFPVERFLREFRKLSKQKVHIEASISEKWIERQVMVFATEYLKSTSVEVPHLWSIVESIQDKMQGGTTVNIEEHERITISNFLLQNEPEMNEFLQAYEDAQQSDPSLPLCCNIHWLRSYIQQRTTSNKVQDISLGCLKKVRKFSGMWYRGKHFRPLRFDLQKQTMDRFVCADWEGVFIAHRGDRNPIRKSVRYTGEIIDIVEANFGTWSKVLLKVEWFKLISGGRNQSPRMMENGFEAVNTTQRERAAEYIYPERCSQCYLVEVPGKPNWSYIIEVEPRFRWIPRQNIIVNST